MRAFLAIEPDDGTRRFLGEIQRQLKQTGVTGHYSFPENLHLTVRFLGEINDGQFGELKKMIKEAARLNNKFVLNIDTIGKFGKGNKMILWAGMNENNSLSKLYDDIEFKLDAMMNLRKENYFPHITLVREAVSPIGFSDIRSRVGKVEYDFPVPGLSLMESTRVNGRLAYIRRSFEPFEHEQ